MEEDVLLGPFFVIHMIRFTTEMNSDIMKNNAMLKLKNGIIMSKNVTNISNAGGGGSAVSGIKPCSRPEVAPGP